MCSTLLDVLVLQDLSAQLLQTLVTSLKQIFDPNEVSTSTTVSTCLGALNNISAIANSGYITNRTVATTLAAVISDFIQSVAFASNQLSYSSNAIQDSIHVIHSTLGMCTGLYYNGL